MVSCTYCLGGPAPESTPPASDPSNPAAEPVGAPRCKQHCFVTSEHWMMDSGRWTVVGGQWTVRLKGTLHKDKQRQVVDLPVFVPEQIAIPVGSTHDWGAAGQGRHCCKEELKSQ